MYTYIQLLYNDKKINYMYICMDLFSVKLLSIDLQGNLLTIQR